MRLQAKISIYLVISLLLSAFLSVLFINIFVLVFDKNYSRYDLEKITVEIKRKIESLQEYNKENIKNVFKDYDEYSSVFFLSYFDMDNSIFISNSPFDMPPPGRRDFREEMEREEERINKEMRQNFRFMAFFSTKDFVIRKGIVVEDKFRGAVMLSVKKEFLFPFYIRINNEKMYILYGAIFVAIFGIVFVSYCLILLFTYPLIKRLKNLYYDINSFDLENRREFVDDIHNDEIGVLSKTFNKMAAKIIENYDDMKKYYQDRQDLLKNISHDFRTPLTSILGYSVSLEEGVFESQDEQKEYYKIIRKKAEYMSLLFDEMMELTRLDNNTFVLTKKDIDIAELLRSIIIEYIPELEKEGFFIDIDIPEKLMLLADGDRLSRVVRNLIDNVLKHGSDGKYIGFKIRSENGNCYVEISDKGCGVGENDKMKIFDRFYRVSQSGGMGLGLTIAKDIILKHGGTIDVGNNSFGGAVFTIKLPI